MTHITDIQIRTYEGVLHHYDIHTFEELIQHKDEIYNQICKISFNIGDIDYRWLNEDRVWINQPLSILTNLVMEKSKFAESQGDYDAIHKMCNEEFFNICHKIPEYCKSFEELMEFIKQNI